jgi:hypothetical protein
VTYPVAHEVPNHSILATPAQVAELIAREEATPKQLSKRRFERERAEEALRAH